MFCGYTRISNEIGLNKPCKDCKHCVMIDSNSVTNAMCCDRKHDQTCEINGSYLTGKKFTASPETYNFCSEERGGISLFNWFKCGPSGKYFEKATEEIRYFRVSVEIHT